MAALDALDKIVLPPAVIVAQAVWIGNLKKVRRSAEAVEYCMLWLALAIAAPCFSPWVQCGKHSDKKFAARARGLRAKWKVQQLARMPVSAACLHVLLLTCSFTYMCVFV